MKKIAMLMVVLVCTAVAFTQEATYEETAGSDQRSAYMQGSQFASADEDASSGRKAEKQAGAKNTQESPSPYINGKATTETSGFKFGYTPTDCTIFHAFFIKNTGTDTLDIVKVRPG